MDKHVWLGYIYIYIYIYISDSYKHVELFRWNVGLQNKGWITNKFLIWNLQLFLNASILLNSW
jgi:hypothetical protein